MPSIVCMHAGSGPDATEHFRLVLGYDADADQVIYHEPAERGGAYRRMGRELFLRLWPLKYDRSTWTVTGSGSRAEPPPTESPPPGRRAPISPST